MRNSPLSEATRGVVTVMNALGLDASAPDLNDARDFFRAQKLEDHLSRIMDIARVSDVVMTNDPFDEKEVATWDGGAALDTRFHAALRMDRLLNDWPNASAVLQAEGYAV